jgi:hypothetical protein
LVWLKEEPPNASGDQHLAALLSGLPQPQNSSNETWRSMGFANLGECLEGKHLEGCKADITHGAAAEIYSK